MNSVTRLPSREIVNKLEQEGHRSQLNVLVKHLLSGAVVAHHKAKNTEDEVEKQIQDAVLMTYIGAIAEATGLHETGPIIYKAIVAENKTFIPELHSIATRIQPNDAA